MSDDSFQGSQAFNRISSAVEDVIPNSGSLLLNVPIIGLMGVHSGIGLKVDLSYSLGAPGALGLPPNWSFGIPMLAPGGALSIDGRRYIVDPTWTDATGYASGLKYENNHGVAFVDNVVSQDLPYGQFGVQYQFTYTDADGAVCYFDSTGALLMKADRFGNFIYYAYAPSPTGSLLDYIIDSFGQKTAFDYAAGQIRVTLPDQRVVTIQCDANAVYGVVDPLGQMTSFTNSVQGGFSVVSAIAYPSGKTTNVAYTGIGFLSASGQTYEIPVVSDLYFMGPDNQLLAHYQYAYGTQSGGNTFTGLNGGYTLAADADGLLDSNDNAYVYDVQVRTLDAAGTIVALTDNFYSFAHVPLTQNTYVIDSAGVQSGFRQVNSVYDIAQDAHDQQPNYLSPKQTQQLFFASSGAAGVPQLQVTYQYDEYGNTTSKQTSTYDAVTGTFVPCLTEVTSYFTQGAAIKTLVNTATQTDHATQRALQTVNTLTADGCSVASSTVSYSDDGGASWQGWKSRQQTFDVHGRQLSAALAWVAAGMPGVQQVTGQVTYAYDDTAFTVTQTITDARGFDSVQVISTMNGHKLSETSPSGATKRYAYDPIGRLISKTSPSGRQVTHAYSAYASGGENSVTTTTAMGYVKKVVSDPLGRKSAVYDNGNPANAQQLRALSQFKYDVLGNVVYETDVFGNATTAAYNSLGKPTLSVDPLGNQRSITYDLAASSTRSSLNGVAVSMVVSDPFGRAILEERYPNNLSADKSSPYVWRQTSNFDGFGQLQSRTVSQVIGDVQTPLHTRSYQYDAESQPIGELFTAADGSTRLIQRRYDLNKKEVSHSKTVTYAGGRSYTVASDVCQYDARGQIVTLTNRTGQVESYVHDGDHHLVQKTLFDGSVIEYRYTGDGKKKQESWKDAGGLRSVTYQYDDDGHLLATSDTNGAVRNSYSLDGVLTSITYPDGRTLSYGLDEYSRKISQTDVTGAVTRYAYTAQNQLQSVTTVKDKLTYSYYANTQMNALFGAPQSVTLANNYTESYQYDAHGRRNGTQRIATDGRLLLGQSNVYDALDRVIASNSSSALTAATTVNCQRAYGYDGFGQLIADTITGGNGQVVSAETFQYDGNGNVLQKTGPSAGASTTYSYNALDQLTQYAQNGTVRTQTYDTNGRLLADGDGNAYAYDVPGKLLSVSGAAGTTSYSYYPNDLLAARTSAGATVGMYYDHLKQVINTAQGGALTQFLMVGARRFASYRAGAAGYYYGANQRQDTVLGCRAPAAGQAALVGSASYASYGAQTDLSVGLDATNNFAWNQEYADIDNGLIYLRARYYDPSSLRFISRDSKRLDNRYAFGNADPVNHVDPSGHDASNYVGLGVGLGVGAVGAGVAVYLAVTYGAAVTAAAGGAGVLAGVGAGALAAAAAVGLGAGAGTAGAIGGAVALASSAVMAVTGVASASVGGTVGGAVGATLGGAVGFYVTGSVGGTAVGASVGGVLGAVVGNASEAVVGTAASYASAAASTTVGYASTALGTAMGYLETATALAAETSVAEMATAAITTATTMAVEAASAAAAAVGTDGLATLALLAFAAFL